MNRPAQTNGAPLWRPYVLAAGLLALSGGFLLGGLLFVLRASGAGGDAWQGAAAQAHGQIQIVGWGGLMILGVGLHFLPRMVSVPLARPAAARAALWLLVAGLLLRATSQPLLDNGLSHGVRLGAGASLVTGALLELAGATIVVRLLLGLGRGMTASAKKRITSAVVGLVGFGLISLWLAIALNGLGAIEAAVRGQALISSRLDHASVLLGLLGFLVPVSVAMSARLFPLYVATQMPRNAWLTVAALALISGLLIRLVGELARSGRLNGGGQIIEAAGIVAAAGALRIFERRRTLPRRVVRIWNDPLQLHLVSAYGWLCCAAFVLLCGGLEQFGVALWSPPLDVERHLIGAGFITLLIFGVGSEMLPGFTQASLHIPRLRWATLIIGNLAALWRVAPLLLPALTGSDGQAAIMSVAGLFDALAIILFLANLPLRRSACRSID